MSNLESISGSTKQSVSASEIAEHTLLKCRRCKNYFSILALHDGYCFNCAVERFKEQKIKALGFDYVTPILAGKEPKPIHIATRRRKLKSWTFRGVL